jgi:hypothetical protein
VTKNPTVGALAERVYNFWARYRMQVTGRPALEVMGRVICVTETLHCAVNFCLLFFRGETDFVVLLVAGNIVEEEDVP